MCGDDNVEFLRIRFDDTLRCLYGVLKKARHRSISSRFEKRHACTGIRTVYCTTKKKKIRDELALLARATHGFYYYHNYYYYYNNIIIIILFLKIITRSRFVGLRTYQNLFWIFFPSCACSGTKSWSVSRSASKCAPSLCAWLCSDIGCSWTTPPSASTARSSKRCAGAFVFPACVRRSPWECRSAAETAVRCFECLRTRNKKKTWGKLTNYALCSLQNGHKQARPNSGARVEIADHTDEHNSNERYYWQTKQRRLRTYRLSRFRIA